MDIKRNIGITLTLLIFQFGFASSDCFSLPEVENSSNNSTGPGPYASRTVVKFECDFGFNPTSGSKLYICSGNSWENGSLRCEKIYCGHVETPENIIVKNKPTYEIGSSIIFDCKEGYNVVGQPNAKCENDGNWLPREPPKCQVKVCGDFGSIQHAKTFQDSNIGVTNGFGSEVKVTCEPGYVIDGPLVVMCQADGNWGKRPTCKKSTCPHYPGLDSSCIKNTQVQGNFLNMTCKNDVPMTKTGPDLIECIDGQWEIITMGCYCNCKVMANLTLVILHNVNEGYINHTHILEWSCKNGSTKLVTEPLLCYSGNTLNPVCQSSRLPITDPPSIKSPEAEHSKILIWIILGVFVLAGVPGAVGVCIYMKCRRNNSASTDTMRCNGLLSEREAMDGESEIRHTNDSNGHIV